MTLNRLKETVLFFSLIALCFDAYAFYFIASFPVTLSLICVVLVLFIGILEIIFDNKKLKSKQLLICLALILFIVLDVIFVENRDLSSAFLYIFYLLTFSVSGYETTENIFYKKLKTVMIVYTVLSVYAIYQFIAYYYDLPLKEILIEGHMVEGFNRTNLVVIAGNVFQRAHSIYLEPSTLSQFSAFAIMISIILCNKKQIKIGSCIGIISLNLIAAVMSVAGTGFLMLGVIIVYYCIIYVIKHGFNKKVVAIFLIILAGTLCAFLIDSPITEYIIIRICEIIDPKYSGGMRFSYPYIIMIDAWANNFFGVTPGNEFIAISDYFDKIGIPPTFSTMASGYAKIGVELGLLGLILLFVLMYTVRQKETGCKYIFVFMLCINFVGGNLLQNYFWIFVMLLNVKFINRVKCNIIRSDKLEMDNDMSRKKLVVN